MLTHARNSSFENISQRAVYPYLDSLISCTAGVPVGLSPQEWADLEPSARQLQAFLDDLYTLLYQSPEKFGLPLDEDASIVGNEEDPKQFKQDVKKKLDRPLKLIQRGMDFLLEAGKQAKLVEAGLLLETDCYAQLLKENKIKKIFLSGLASTGWESIEAGEHTILTCSTYPHMMPALQKLAQACGKFENSRLGKFNFARADFRALDSRFTPPAQDLYAILDPVDTGRLLRLDQFFSQQNYRPLIQIYGIGGWEVQYQGPTKIKSSPLLRIQLDMRYRVTLKVDIKCASTNRIIPLIYRQPRFLQEDFSQRVYYCKDNLCNWCQDKKGLGPSVFEFDGQRNTICWYHNPTIPELNEDSLQLVQQYTLMHAELAEVV